MTHEYTILTGGTVLAGNGAPECTAIAWAHDTVLLVGSDEEARAISRGDSHFVDLGGRFIVPLEDVLEAGRRADLVVLNGDPRVAGASPPTVALVRGGRVCEGSLDL